MDRSNLIVQRAREWFGDRIDDVLHMVRQDRQDLRGWEEPAHLRAVARRTMRDAASVGHLGSTGSMSPMTGGNTGTDIDTELMADIDRAGYRAAAEPEPGQQREATGILLERAAAALERITRTAAPTLSPEEIFGLEAALLMYGRPAVQVSDNRLGSVSPLWNVLEDQRDDVEMAQRGVGRIELLGHPEFDWAGTGFLVGDTCLMTTRRTLEVFAERAADGWQFRPGISAWMNFRAGYQLTPTAGCRIRSVIGAHDVYDLALLEVEPARQNPDAPVPLMLAAQPPERLDGRPTYLVGYPARDARRNEPEAIARVFRDVYDVKRVQPGVLRGCLEFRDVRLLRHDAAPLGSSAGGCLIDMETHQVIGLHLTGRYLDGGTAVPLWGLRDDPLFQRAGVGFASATSQEVAMMTGMIERLTRSRVWPEARETLLDLYRRAFGTNAPMNWFEMGAGTTTAARGNGVANGSNGNGRRD